MPFTSMDGTGVNFISKAITVFACRCLDELEIKNSLNSEYPEEADCFCHPPGSEWSEAQRFPPDLLQTFVSLKCIINITRLLRFQGLSHNIVSVLTTLLSIVR